VARAPSRPAEAKGAAAEVADQQNLTSAEREDAAASVAGSPADDAAGHPTGEGAEVAPG
jgi:hypothetical protein